jgi:hypothetical protein
MRRCAVVTCSAYVPASDLLAAAASDNAPTPQVITAMQELKDSKFRWACGLITPAGSSV